MVEAGCRVKIWIDDWSAFLNNKLGGDMEKIQTVGRYMIEVWKSIGMNHDGVEFLCSSAEINSRADEYWPRVMGISTHRKIGVVRYFLIFALLRIAIITWHLSARKSWN